MRPNSTVRNISELHLIANGCVSGKVAHAAKHEAVRHWWERGDAATGALIAKFKGQNIRVSQSSRQILKIDGGECVSNVYDAYRGRQLSTFRVRDGCFRISDAAITGDDRQVVAFDSGGRVVIWNIAGQQVAPEFEMFVPTLAALVLPQGHNGDHGRACGDNLGPEINRGHLCIGDSSPRSGT